MPPIRLMRESPRPDERRWYCQGRSRRRREVKITRPEMLGPFSRVDQNRLPGSYEDFVEGLEVLFLLLGSLAMVAVDV